MTDMKVFTGPTLEAAERQAKQWIDMQADIQLTLNPFKERHSSGSWTVFIYFQRTLNST